MEMTEKWGLGTLLIFVAGTVASFTPAMAGELKLKDIAREDLSIDERVQMLESKVDNHEKTLSEKLTECHLEYKKLGRRATWCPEGTVVTEVEKIYGTDMLNVSCAKPVLRCEKLGVQIEL